MLLFEVTFFVGNNDCLFKTKNLSWIWKVHVWIYPGRSEDRFLVSDQSPDNWPLKMQRWNQSKCLQMQKNIGWKPISRISLGPSLVLTHFSSSPRSTVQGLGNRRLLASVPKQCFMLTGVHPSILWQQAWSPLLCNRWVIWCSWRWSPQGARHYCLPSNYWLSRSRCNGHFALDESSGWQAFEVASICTCVLILSSALLLDLQRR